ASAAENVIATINVNVLDFMLPPLRGVASRGAGSVVPSKKEPKVGTTVTTSVCSERLVSRQIAGVYSPKWTISRVPVHLNRQLSRRIPLVRDPRFPSIER